MSIFPLFPAGAFGHYEGHVLGILLGMAFGFVLERAGFGRASNLAAQFYGVDNRVFKVMFTGIATTTVLIGLLSALGLVSIDALTVPETWIGPQIVGGLLLGAGFVIAGYCPGTGVVAAASGSVDGWVTYLGVILGTIVFGLAWPALEGFYLSGGMGVLRLDQVLGLSFPVTAALVLALAAGGFFGAERLEAWLAARRGGVAPDVAPRTRNLVLGILAAVAVLGVPPSAGTPAAASVAPLAAIAPIDLAGRLVDDPRGLWLVDLRDPAVCAAGTVPGATCRPADDADGKFLADLPATRTLVLIDQPGSAPVAGALTWPGDVRMLEGGYAAFKADLLTPPTPPADPTLAALEAYERQTALHAWITGTPASAPAVTVKKASAGPVAKKGGGC